MEFNASSPFEAITGNDDFLDGSSPFPVTATTVRQGTPPNSSQLTDVFTSVTTKTGQQTLNAGSVGYGGGVPTLPLPLLRTYFLGQLTPQGPFHPTLGFPSHVPGQPFPGFWPYCGLVTIPVVGPQGATSNLSVPAPPLAVSSSSVSVPAALPTSSLRHQFNQITDSGPSLERFKSILDDFVKNNAKKSNSPVISLPQDHNIESDLEDSDEEERFSVAPGSNKGFTSDEEGDNPVQDSQNVSQSSVPVSISSFSVIGRSSTNSSKDPEAEDTPSTLKALRDSVNTIMRDVNKVPFQSPPRPKRLTSIFEASYGLSIDNAKSHTSFPQSNHTSTSLQIINDGIVANESQFSQVSGFGLASFTEQFRSKDCDIFDSTMGKLVPKCEKALLSPIVFKPGDGLLLSLSLFGPKQRTFSGMPLMF
ncbi:unnamed protein product [Mytilus coruscus]|uniref:Uncharacterized protein n=1 Tax=Mytilus coruscus TaxID=42192 RepID=A0A6J8BEQ3_MYTCO|nr:unnamed protein product [Mytilus coruscus]